MTNDFRLPNGLRRINAFALSLLALVFLFASATLAPTATAQSRASADQESRINGLVKTGRAMLTNQQYARAYKHFLTYTRQEPEEARLYRWLVISSVYAERKEALTDLMVEAADQAEPTTRLPFDSDLSDYALAELAMSDSNIDAVRSLLEGFPERNAPSVVLVLKGQVALLESDFAEAQRLATLAHNRDPNDPEAARLTGVSTGLNAMTTELTKVIADPGAYEFLDMTSSDIFGAALLLPYQPQVLQEQVGTQLIEAYLSIGNRNDDLRLLVDVFRSLSDLSVGGAEALQEIEGGVNELAARSPDFAESTSFLQVLELVGRFWLAVREYDRAYDTFDQIQEIQAQRGDVTEQACSLVILGRAATLMGRRDEAKDFRDRARELTEQEAQKSRSDLVRSWGGFWPFVGVAALALLTVLSLVGSRVLAPGLMTPLAKQESRIARVLSNQTTRSVWVRALWLLVFAIAATALMLAVILGLLALDWASVEVFKWRDDTFVYGRLYEWTHVGRLMAVTGGVLFLLASLALLIFATSGRHAPAEVAERIDSGMNTGGSLEAYVTAVGRGPKAEISERNPVLVAKATNITRSGVPGWIFPFALSPIFFAVGLILLASVLTGFRYLPTPEQPTPPLCDPDTYVPPPFIESSQNPPPQQQRQAPMGGQGEGETGLDVSDSEVPDGALDDLLNEQSVGGLDDAGEPLDYYTRLPDRQFNIDRSTPVDANSSQSGSYRLEDTGLRPRQAVPERYRGTWD